LIIIHIISFERFCGYASKGSSLLIKKTKKTLKLKICQTGSTINLFVSLEWVTINNGNYYPWDKHWFLYFFGIPITGWDATLWWNTLYKLIKSWFRMLNLGKMKMAWLMFLIRECESIIIITPLNNWEINVANIFEAWKTLFLIQNCN
jgi:hypothetical protein